jgi:hypothetical protein
MRDKAPNHKHQASNKFEIEMFNDLNERHALERSEIGVFAEFRSLTALGFGFVCDLVLDAWSLFIGAWSFPRGVAE